MTDPDEFAALSQRILTLESELAELGSVLDDVTRTVYSGVIPDLATAPDTPDATGTETDSHQPPGTTPTTPTGTGRTAGPVEPMFPTLTAYVEQAFAPVYCRPTSPTLRWCARWWGHAEAIYRLEALWRTWELYRLEPRLGIASWLRDYLDPQLAALTSPTGPFAQCTEQRHRELTPLPTTPPPAHHFDEP